MKLSRGNEKAPGEGRVMLYLQRCSGPMSRTCEYVTLYGRRVLAHVNKILKMRLLFSGPSVIQSVFLRERGRPRKPDVRSRGWRDDTTGRGLESRNTDNL